MKIAAVCCTYLRPEKLGHMVRCFLKQDYPDRELVILDDAGQYDNQEGDRWRLISVNQRFPSLGEKRNAAVEMASPDAEAFAVWDDDDVYLPWALSASVAALKVAPWSRPSRILRPRGQGRLSQHGTGGLFHASWAYTRAIFEGVGGYPAMNNGEDQAFAKRLKQAGAKEADPIRLGFRPFFVWGCDRGWHISLMARNGYARLGRRSAEPATLLIADPPQCDLDDPQILPSE